MSNPQEIPEGELLDDEAAFNVRRKTGSEGTIFAGGDFLYRVFPMRERVFFIKLDAGTDRSMALMFGLLGILIHKYLIKGKEAARAKERQRSYAGQRPSLLLAEDKANHVLQRAQITKQTIHPPSFWTGGKFGKWIFRDAKNKKRMFLFEDVENFQAAVTHLRDVFGDEIVVKAQYDPVKGKIVKIKPGA